MSVYKASLYNYLFNSINSIVIIINGILLVPLYFHYMPVSVYGAWLASGNLMAMIGLFGSGFAGVITQKMAAAISQNKKNEFLELAGANIMTATIIAALIFITAMVLSPFVANIVNVDSEYAIEIQRAFQVSALATSLAILVSLFGAFPQVWQETRQIGMINVFVNILGILTTVIALLGGMGVISLPLGYLTRAVMNLLLQGGWIVKYWKRNEPSNPIFKLRTIPYIIKANALPFTSSVCNVLMNHSQSLIIASAMNPALAAIYDITGKVALCLFNFVVMAKGSFFALLSLTFGKGDLNESNRVSKTIIQYFSIFIASIMVFSVLFSKTIVYYWVGLDKFGGDLLLLLIVISSAVGQYNGFLNDFLFSGGQINRSAKYDIFSIVLYLGLLFSFVGILGEYSIPLSMLIVKTMFVVLYMRFIKKYMGLDTAGLYGLIIKNIMITIPFIVLYFVLSLDCTNLWLQVIVLIVTAISLFVCLMTANKQVYITLKDRLQKILPWR